MYNHEYILMILYFYLDNPRLSDLHAMATARLAQAYRPATRAHMRTAMKKFLAFTVEYNVDIRVLQQPDILSFLEYLVIKGLKYNSIVSYLSLLKNSFRMYSLPVYLLESVNVKLMLRACSITMDFSPSVKNVFTIPILHKIIAACTVLRQPLLYRSLFLLAFIGFLRISNCVPRSSKSFDKSRQLARGDVILTSPGLQVIVKWSKTIQACNNFKTIPIPTIVGHPLCPVKAFKTYIERFPARDDHPMFYFCDSRGHRVIVTEKHARTALATVLRAINLPPKDYGFITFRRSGATLAYKMDVPLTAIQQHGTWLSNAVWAYIQPTPQQTPVVQAFASIPV